MSAAPRLPADPSLNGAHPAKSANADHDQVKKEEDSDPYAVGQQIIARWSDDTPRKSASINSGTWLS